MEESETTEGCQGGCRGGDVVRGGVPRRRPHAHEDTGARVQPSPQAAEEPRNLTGSTFASSS